MKAVFDTKADSPYKDEITEHYHFPSNYLNVAENCVGDWIVYHEPRAGGGSMSYFAVAKVDRIDADPEKPKHFYARMSNYLPFDEPVPWTVNQRYWEQDLRDLPTAQVGVFLRGKSLRRLTDSDFEAIIRYGLGNEISSAIVFGETYVQRPPDDEEFREGRVATRVHKFRERDPKLRQQVLADRRKNGRLTCDCCSCCSPSESAEYEDAIFEIHHLMPVALSGERRTTFNDVVLLCANCHRLTHRGIAKLKAWLSLDEIKALYMNRHSILQPG